ncbi:unnamed protein product, partial [Discosporangium mesarthrocarpum]
EDGGEEVLWEVVAGGRGGDDGERINKEALPPPLPPTSQQQGKGYETLRGEGEAPDLAPGVTTEPADDDPEHPPPPRDTPSSGGPENVGSSVDEPLYPTGGGGGRG